MASTEIESLPPLPWLRREDNGTTARRRLTPYANDAADTTLVVEVGLAMATVTSCPPPLSTPIHFTPTFEEREYVYILETAS
ncbi:hypothetical protein M0R89_11625 [Halorussus limi]|uniref:Uncharacterized protein n=1 Tax=Halorussus limi TaxID=2938695 RepID=A0A8U0HQM9_9EURY|nr:hypothetical protein [Halorussus limi]UPV73197.1 hypothetical protein M0R89_11625 [Halorussus limi]